MKIVQKQKSYSFDAFILDGKYGVLIDQFLKFNIKGENTVVFCFKILKGISEVLCYLSRFLIKAMVLYS